MKNIFLLSTVLLINAFKITAQQVKSYSTSAIQWQLEDLKGTGSVLYIAAHPDDENTRLISYLVNQRHIRTAYLSLTRGDGGQNLIGTEKGPQLGMLRTQELLAARRIDNGTQYFSRAYDFGYSKNPEETFQFWNKDSVLADVVWVIRTFQPDVIICRFPTTGEGGHGHHIASAILAEEAFAAAADPNKFPGQLKHTTPWQATRLVWNTFNFGSNNTIAEDQLKIDVGGYNPLLGKYNGEIAADSRTMHKSQGFGSEKSRGSQWEYFKPIKGKQASKDIMDDVDLSWNRIQPLKDITAKLNQAIRSLQQQPDNSILPILFEVYQSLQQQRKHYPQNAALITSKLQQLSQLILSTSNIWVDATTNTQTAIRGQNIKVNYSMVKSSKEPISLVGIKTNHQDSTMKVSLEDNKMIHWSSTYKISQKAAYTSPFWLVKDPIDGMFPINDLWKNTKADNDLAITATFCFQWQNEDTFSITIPVRYKSVDPVKGEVYQPLRIVPAATIQLPNTHYLFASTTPKTIPITITSFEDSLSARLNIQAPKGWQVSTPTNKIHLKGKVAQTVVFISITPSDKAENGSLQISLQSNFSKYNKSLTTISYDHIPTQQLIQPASTQLIYERMQVPAVTVGYIPGAGDDIPAILKEMNVSVTELSNEQLAIQELSQYDVIVSGVRAYNVNEKLQALHPRLMEYIQQGGNLIVQYNTNSRVGPLKIEMGPYPFTISRNRVTNENAPVSFLAPNHAVFNYPNKITAKDFEGWVQERGIYFAADWGQHYLPLLRMNDKGELPNEGALIVASYGKGNFVYTGLSFFRELPSGVSGAYKLFFNLLALSKPE